MLRFNHMASDFHPLFLFLGEAADLLALANILSRFSSDAQVVALEQIFPQGENKVRLTLEPATDRFGLRHNAGEQFTWRLNAWQAQQLAERIAQLTPRARKSGSDIFELGDEGEIPVKVSLGEFTDDFLVSKF